MRNDDIQGPLDELHRLALHAAGQGDEPAFADACELLRNYHDTPDA
jgi:hypothetical protein